MGTRSTVGLVKAVKVAAAFIAAIVTCLLLLAAAVPAQATTPDEALSATTAHMRDTVTAPTVGSIGGEWAVVGLARAEATVPDGYWQGYVKRVEDFVVAKGPKLNPRKSTDNSRVILALTALRRDPRSIAEKNLLAPLADMNWVTEQGINGAIFTLIATQSGGYAIPTDPGVANQATEAKLITFILDRELNKGTDSAGGWSLGGSELDPDITAMALQACAAYYRSSEHADVTAAVDRALAALSAAQLSDGGFASAEFAGGTANCESSAQVIIALTALGIDPTVDSRFVKADSNPITALLGFYQGGGVFNHDATGSGESQMSTEQALLSLVAYQRLKAGKPSLYSMSDAIPTAPMNVTISVEQFTVNKSYVVLPTKMSIPAGSTAAQATVGLLGERNYRSVGSATSSSFYLRGIRVAGANYGGDEFLDEFDERANETSLSGWKITVNNAFIGTSAGAHTLTEGDVVRWQFTRTGDFAGIEDVSSPAQPADKDELTARVAEIRALGAETTYGAAYTAALKVLAELPASQDDVNAALAALAVPPPLPSLTKASVSLATRTDGSLIWSGRQLKPAVRSVKIGSQGYQQGRDFSVAYGTNTAIGKGTVKLTAVPGGGLSDARTDSFKIIPKTPVLGTVKAGSRRLAVSFREVDRRMKVTRYQVRYRMAGTTAWKTYTFNRSYTDSKTAAIATVRGLKKGKRYYVSVRAAKSVAGSWYWSYGAPTKKSPGVR